MHYGVPDILQYDPTLIHDIIPQQWEKRQRFETLEDRGGTLLATRIMSPQLRPFHRDQARDLKATVAELLVELGEGEAPEADR
jgi:hypothetical protein